MMLPYVALKASAGSGKTFALSVRYIALLLQEKQVNPNSIMALTFTKKAASEMSSRIILTFLNLDKKVAELAEISRLLDVSKDEVLKRRDERKELFLSANLKIMTFDSFFALILRLFSLNLGLSPDYKSVSSISAELNSHFIKNVANDEKMLKILALYIIGFAKSQSDFFNNLQAFYENFDTIDVPNASFPSDKKVMQILAWLKNKICANKNASKTAKELFDIASIDELLQKAFLQRENLQDYKSIGKAYEPELDDKFADLKNELKIYAKQLEDYKKGELARFLQIYKNVRQNLGAKLNELSFADVTKRVHELLCADASNKQMLYFRLDATITHLLIDEFQDTNVDQYDIMIPLIEEILSGSGQNGIGSFFYVGDVKQSIYRFRGGKKELFDKLSSQFRQIKTDNLTHNYRSAKNLVEYINSVFNKSSGVGLFNDNEAQEPASSDEGYIEVCQNDDVVDECVKKVLWLISQGVSEHEISVLCWKNDEVRQICEALRAVGVGARDEGGMLLKNASSVFVLINYAKFCLFGDEIYQKNAQSYFDAKFTKRTLDTQKTAAQSLYYLAKNAKMNLSDANLLRLFELASEQSSLVKFIFEFENSDALIAQNLDFGVRVMTVHKSKGLEFNHVILCDQMGKSRGNTGGFICEYDEQKGWQISLKLANREYFDDEYKILKERSEKLDKDEELNKLYVAMTRAKSSLIIIKKQNPEYKNPSYFSKYMLKNGKEAGHLELKCFNSGRVIPSDAMPTSQKSTKKIEVLAVKHDESVGKDEFDEKNLHAIYFGNALHFLLEMCENFNEQGVKNAAVIMKNKFAKFLPEDSLQDVVQRALSFVNHLKFKEILDGANVFKEQPLVFNGEKKQLDLLCVGDEKVVVVDYKSSDFAVEKNIEQVSQYVQALRQIFTHKQVNGVLFYLLKNEIKFVEI